MLHLEPQLGEAAWGRTDAKVATDYHGNRWQPWHRSSPKPPPRAEARDGAFPTITMVIAGELPPRPSPSHLDGGGLLGDGYYQTITMVIV